MKKFILSAIIAISFQSGAQSIFKGLGVFGSLTQSAHFYKNLDTDKKGIDSIYKYFYPQTHWSKEYFDWGAGIFLELGRGDGMRWQTELEYINKGANERELIEPYSGLRAPNFSPNKFTYIQWNNYLKFYYPLGHNHWYIMPGIRLEYLVSSAPTVFTSVSANFPKFWYSADLGVGYEFPIFKKYSAFVEYHWNQDVLSHQHDNTKVWNRTLELRVGVVMRPRKRSIDDCNAPVYRGPAY